MLHNYENFNNYFNGQEAICLLEKAEEVCEKSYCIRRKNCPIFAIEYIEEGCNTYTIDGQTFTAGVGDVVLLRQGTQHVYGLPKNATCKKKWAVFVGTLVEPLLQAYWQQQEFYGHAPGMQAIFDEICALTLAREPYSQINAKFSVLLYRLLVEMHADRACKREQDKTVAEEICQYIEQNISRPFSLKELSQRFHYSDNYIIMLFKARYGMTPNRYYLRKKTDTACLYLRNTNRSIKDISEELGFADQHYFCNVFRKIKQMTPKQYRDAQH